LTLIAIAKTQPPGWRRTKNPTFSTQLDHLARLLRLNPVKPRETIKAKHRRIARRLGVLSSRLLRLQHAESCVPRFSQPGLPNDPMRREVPLGSPLDCDDGIAQHRLKVV
jgi:hypothetical protein